MLRSIHMDGKSSPTAHGMYIKYVAFNSFKYTKARGLCSRRMNKFILPELSLRTVGQHATSSLKKINALAKVNTFTITSNAHQEMHLSRSNAHVATPPTAQTPRFVCLRVSFYQIQSSRARQMHIGAAQMRCWRAHEQFADSS